MMLDSTLSRPRWAIPSTPAARPVVGGRGEDLVEDRDHRLGALEAEALGADVLRGEEPLEGLGGVEPLEDAQLGVLVERLDRALDLGLDPALLLGVLDVHVLDADGPAVGVAQHAEQLAELHAIDAADAAGEELAVEVPDRQPVGERVELDRHHRVLPAQRVEVGDEMAANPVDANQRGDLHLLLQHRLFAVDRVDVGMPLDGLVGHVQGREDRLVEAVLAEQQLVDLLEEQPALGALDDAVVVRARDRDDLGDAQRREVLAVGALELGRVVDAADADDDPLAGHQPGHALHRADRAGVGERDVGALEVVDRELVRLDLADDLLVGGEELGEVHRAGVLDDRDDERAGAVALVDVDGETHVDGVVDDEATLAIGTGGVAVAHRRHGVGDRPHDGVADDVREADLALSGACAVAVDDVAVDLEQLGRDVAEAGRRRNRQAALHVGGDRRRGALQDGAGLGVGGGRGGGCGGLGGLARGGGSAGVAGGGSATGSAGSASRPVAPQLGKQCRGCRQRSSPDHSEVRAERQERHRCRWRRTRATTRSPNRGRPRTARTSPRRARSWPRSHCLPAGLGGAQAWTSLSHHSG